MKIDKHITKKMAQEAVISNTLAGGIAATKFWAEKKDNQIILNLSTPSVGVEAYQVEIINHHLLLHTVVEQQGDILPLATHTIPLPINVNEEDIEALFENGQLKVHLPVEQNLSRKPIHIRQKRDW